MGGPSDDRELYYHFERASVAFAPCRRMYPLSLEAIGMERTGDEEPFA